MITTHDQVEINAITNGLVAIVQEADRKPITDVELFRRVDLITESYLAEPDLEDSPRKRTLLAETLQAKCDGPACEQVVSHILRNDH